MPPEFECEYCHEAVGTEPAPPRCDNCGTTYRYDDSKTDFVMARSRVIFTDFLALLLAAGGMALLINTATYRSLATFLVFIGLAIHFGHALRYGVISTQFFLFKSPWNIYRAESPLLFPVACLVEGLWLLAFLLMFLFTL